MRFLHVNFKIFSKISTLNWFIAQTRKSLSQCFLLSFIIIKSVHNSIKIALIFIKISFFKSKFARKFHVNFQNSTVFHWFFDYFLIFSWASRGIAPRTPYKSIFPKFSLNFRENIEKVLKNFKKIAIFTSKFFKKIIKFSLLFLTFFENFRVCQKRNFCLLQC